MVRDKLALGGCRSVAALAGCGSHTRPRRAGSRPPARHDGSTPAPTVATTVAPHRDAVGARRRDECRATTSRTRRRRSCRQPGSVARAFFTSYLAYLYGRLPASDVAGADQSLRWQLEHGARDHHPAERASRPRIARLSLASAGPPVSVIAVAVVDAGHGQPSQLTATLEPHRRTWLVVAIGG